VNQPAISDDLLPSTVDIVDLLTHLNGGRADIIGRELIATPYLGAYGLAGAILAVNGSPPRGTIVVDYSFDYPMSVFYINQARSRRLGEQQARMVKRFAVRLFGEVTSQNVPGAIQFKITERGLSAQREQRSTDE
jgi:hypothetical protein